MAWREVKYAFLQDIRKEDEEEDKRGEEKGWSDVRHGPLPKTQDLGKVFMRIQREYETK